MSYLEILKSKDTVVGQVSSEELDFILQEGIPLVLCDTYGMLIKEALVNSKYELKSKDITRLYKIVAKYLDITGIDVAVKGNPVIVVQKNYSNSIKFEKVWESLFDLYCTTHNIASSKESIKTKIYDSVNFVLDCEYKYSDKVLNNINIILSDDTFDIAKYFNTIYEVNGSERIFVRSIGKICDKFQIIYEVNQFGGITMGECENILTKDIYFMEYPRDVEPILIVNFPEIGGGRTLYTNIVKFAIINKLKVIVVANYKQEEVFKDLTLEEITGAINIMNP